MLKKKEMKIGFYRHYKGGKVEVIGLSHHSETLDEFVVYKALYDCRNFGEGSIWVRPKDMFLGEVEYDGKKVPRFEFISEIDDEDKEKFEDRYRRALADYQNLLKQTAKDKTEFVKYANQNLLHDLIPAYDNLKTAIDHADEKNHDTWLEGVKYVAKQFKEALKNNGVEEIKTVGEKFDHHTMDAVQNEETDNKKQDGLVAKELKAGYKLNGKVVIPARVVVYKYNKE